MMLMLGQKRLGSALCGTAGAERHWDPAESKLTLRTTVRTTSRCKYGSSPVCPKHIFLDIYTDLVKSNLLALSCIYALHS